MPPPTGLTAFRREKNSKVTGKPQNVYVHSSGVPYQLFDESLLRAFLYKSKSADTRDIYKRAIREFFAFASWVHPRSVSTADIISYCDYLTAGRGRKANTVRSKVAIVRSFFEYLKSANVVSANPASTRLISPPAPVPKLKRRKLNAVELSYLLSAPDRTTPEGARDHAILCLIALMGLRASEIARLRTSAIEYRNAERFLLIKTKAGDERRPLANSVEHAIQRYLELDMPRRQALHSDGIDAFLFQPCVNYRTLVFDKPLSVRKVQMIAAHWSEACGIGRITPRELRAAFFDSRRPG